MVQQQKWIKVVQRLSRNTSLEMHSRAFNDRLRLDDLLDLSRQRFHGTPHSISEPFFLQVVYVEKAVDDAVARDVLLNVILHGLLELW